LKTRITLILISLLPLPVGFFANHLFMTVWWYIYPAGWHWFTGLFFILLWFACGLIFTRWIESRRDLLICINIVPGLILVMTIIQELIINRFWSNWIGVSTQMYYLPIMHIPARLLLIFPITVRVSSICFVAFCILFLASFLGRRRGEHLIRLPLPAGAGER